MKTLKVKSIAFSLFMAMVFSVFMTSCEQEEMLTPDIETEITDPSLDDDISDRDFSFD